MPVNCVTDVSGCVVCPALPAIPSQPARIEEFQVPGFNAGANSIDQLTGNIHAVFQLPANVQGAFVGFKSDRDLPFVPTLIEHAFYFTSDGGIDSWCVIELGTTVVDPIARDPSDTFEIRRLGKSVRYRVNDELVWISELTSTNAKLVNACLYGSGDTIE